MAKITHKGLWIEVSSLNPRDKKKLTSDRWFALRSEVFFWAFI